jgi:hypothetical protein
MHVNKNQRFLESVKAIPSGSKNSIEDDSARRRNHWPVMKAGHKMGGLKARRHEVAERPRRMAPPRFASGSLPIHHLLWAAAA